MNGDLMLRVLTQMAKESVSYISVPSNKVMQYTKLVCDSIASYFVIHFSIRQY